MSNRKEHLLALDQGTSSSRAIVFHASGRIVAMVQREFRQTAVRRDGVKQLRRRTKFCEQPALWVGLTFRRQPGILSSDGSETRLESPAHSTANPTPAARLGSRMRW